MNINRLLENSKRISLIGRNMYTAEGFLGGDRWTPPAPGLSGQLAIGHGLPVTDAVVPHCFLGEETLSFRPVRHRWTPAWQITHYRSAAQPAYYAGEGCFVLQESKCITGDDIFVARAEIFSDRREEVTLSIRLDCALPELVDIPVHAGAMGCDLRLRGGCSLANTAAPENTFSLTIPAQGSASFSYAFAFRREGASAAAAAVRAVLSAADPLSDSESRFHAFFDGNVPLLHCEDPDIMKTYYYRWFLLYRAIHDPSAVIEGHPIPGSCMYESPFGDWFGCPVGLPVPQHLEEAKWMRSPEIPRADAQNWRQGITCYRGYIQYTPMAVWHLYRQHPDSAFLREVYPACRAYTLSAFPTGRETPSDPPYAFLPTVDSSWPTGAEYQPAFYQHAPVPWSWRYDGEGFASGLADPRHAPVLHRLDHIAYTVGNLLGCASMAEELAYTEDAVMLRRLAERCTDALKAYFWSEKQGCFVSVDTRNGAQCDEAVCYDSFYPYLWDMVGGEYLRGLEPLLRADTLGSPFSFTTADKHCPMYWFDNCITGPGDSSLQNPHSYSCCWNGPVWPYAASGMLDALGTAARTDESLRGAWLERFAGYTELHFLGGDRSVPLVTEHYRPTDGVSFHGTCDYFHSTWIDLFMKYWAGISMEDGGIGFTPFAACEFTLEGVQMGSRLYRLTHRRVGGAWQATVEVIQ